MHKPAIYTSKFLSCLNVILGAHGKAGLGHGHGYLRMHDGGTRLLDVPILPL